MKFLGSRILIAFSISVTLSRIVRILFVTASTLGYAISISLCCVFAIIYTFMAYCTFNYTYVNNCSSYATTFSSLASFRIIYASI
jgi:hypothetical protein